MRVYNTYFSSGSKNIPVFWGLVKKEKKFAFFAEIDEECFPINGKITGNFVLHDSHPLVGTNMDLNGNIDINSKSVSFECESFEFSFKGTLSDCGRYINGNVSCPNIEQNVIKFEESEQDI